PYALVILFIAVFGAIVLGALAGIVALAKAAFRIPQTARCTVLGQRLREEEYPDLWQYVRECAVRLGALLPHHLVVGLEPTFFATEAQVHCLDGTLTGRTLYFSLPLCRLLTTEELRAILGHELSHFQGLDTHFSQRFYPLYRGSLQALASLASTTP